MPAVQFGNEDRFFDSAPELSGRDMRRRGRSTVPKAERMEAVLESMQRRREECEERISRQQRAIADERQQQTIKQPLRKRPRQEARGAPSTSTSAHAMSASNAGRLDSSRRSRTTLRLPRFTIEKNGDVIVSGPDKHQVGQFAANIRDQRRPEPYNGKGIMYDDEVIIRKQGKVFGS